MDEGLNGGGMHYCFLNRKVKEFRSSFHFLIGGADDGGTSPVDEMLGFACEMVGARSEMDSCVRGVNPSVRWLDSCVRCSNRM